MSVSNHVSVTNLPSENAVPDYRQLAAGVAHEIRNPLASLQGFVQLLMKQGVSPTYLNVMQEELARIERITGELLALAKPVCTDWQRCDIDALLRHVVLVMEPQAAKQRVHIMLPEPDCEIRIDADPDQIKQVLINVVKNAIEAMPDGGRVEIGTSICGDELEITVQDEGAGLTKEQLARVGKPYYTTKEGGSGLGLMMCRSIAERHRGRLTLESAPGCGTRVQLILPLQRASSSAH